MYTRGTGRVGHWIRGIALKDLAKSTNVVHKYMIAIERKQIPVCRVHHLELHGVIGLINLEKYTMKPSNVGEPCDG